MLTTSNAHGAVDYDEITTEDSISLSINRSTTTSTTRQRVTRPPTPNSSVSSPAPRQRAENVPVSVNRSDATTPPWGDRCLNRDERFTAMRENRECDPWVQPEMRVMPRATAPDPAPAPVPAVNNQPQVVEEPVEIVITASDLLELIPASPEILMDRGPFGLKNAHTNFYASNHTPQTVTQTMFDQEVTITATPIEYRWDYGDGDSLVTELPGHPVDVFNTETDTSHQYTDTGLYSVGLTTVFEGTYQVDGGETQMVSSTVTQQAAPVEIRIWRAVTRNVDQTCEQDPQAWGC